MGELARRRRARDLWVSRSHVWALGVGVVLLVIIAFALGSALSGGRGPAPAVASEAPQESLVDLLARIDAGAVSQDGVQTLTFPDTLTGVADDPGLPEAVPAPATETAVAPGQPGLRPFDLILPAADDEAAADLVQVLARAGWTGRVERDPDGDAVRVVLDGGEDLAAAEQARERLAADLERLEQPLAPTLHPR